MKYSFIRINPMGKPRMLRYSYKHNPTVKKYWQYKDLLKLLAPKNIDWESLSVTFLIPMPISWSKKKCKKMNGTPHLQTPDLDNLVKALQDCLLSNDAAVWHYSDIRKIWGESGAIMIGVKDENR